MQFLSIMMIKLQRYHITWLDHIICDAASLTKLQLEHVEQTVFSYALE